MSPWSSSAGYGAGAFGQGGWSAAAVAKLGEYVAAMPHQPARKEEMARRRKLLQVDPTASANDDAAFAAATAAAAAADGNTTTTTADWSYFGECKGSNLEYLNPTFVMDPDGNPAVDIEGTPMVKFTLPRNFIAKARGSLRTSTLLRTSTRPTLILHFLRTHV